MAQYTVLIYGPEPPPMTDVPPEMKQAYQRLTEQVAELGGEVLASHALQPASMATTVRDDVITDGPFVESKEGLGGFLVIEARDLDHALAIAKLVPVPGGGVEVRPVISM